MLAWNVQPAICCSVDPDKIVVAAGAVVVATNNSPTEIPAIVLALPVIGKVPDNVAEAVISAASLMFNLTPAKYRPLYKIYPDRFYKADEVWEKYGLFKREESYKMLEERMQVEINK